MDLFPSRIRFRNIFGQEGDDPTPNITKNIFPIQHSTAVNKDALDTPSDAESRLMDIYNSPSPAASRLADYVNTQPDRTDYEPSRKRKLGAVLAGFVTGMADPNAGAAVTRGILDKPFDEANEDWERRGVPIRNAALAEQVDRTQKINSLKDYITAKRLNLNTESEMQARRDLAKHNNNSDLETAIRDQETAKYHTDETKSRDAANAREISRDSEAHRHNIVSEEIARKNAESTATRVSAYTNNVNSLTAHRNNLLNNLKNIKGDTPAAQKTAKEVALHNIVLKPGNSQKYGDFYDMDDKGRIVVKPVKQGSFESDEDFQNRFLNYSAFQREIEDDAKKVLANNHPSTDSKPPDTKIPPPPPATVVRRNRG